MVSVCLDTTITTTKCSRYTFRPFDYAPAQAVAFAPYLVSKMGKKWHIAYLDYAWGQSTKDAYVEQIKKMGGEYVGGTGIPLGTADMAAFVSKITGNFDGLFGIFFGANAVNFTKAIYDLGLTKKYKYAGRRRHRRVHAPGRARPEDRGLRRRQPLRAGARPAARTPRITRSSSTRRWSPLKKIDPSGPLPDRYVQSNFEAMNFLKLGIQKSGFRGREDTMKLIEALEGWRSRKATTSRRATRPCARRITRPSCASSSSTIKGGKHKIAGGGAQGEDDRPARLQIRLGVTGRSTQGAGRRPATAGAPASRSFALRVSPSTSAGWRPSTASPLDVARRRDPRHHRPQRRRQVDPLQLPDRRAPADARAGSCSTARTSPGCRPT